jgi:hypothetical protein
VPVDGTASDGTCRKAFRDFGGLGLGTVGSKKWDLNKSGKAFETSLHLKFLK